MGVGRTIARGVVVALVATVVVIVVESSPASACSCVGGSDTARHLERADAVFTGTVVGTRRTTDSTILELGPGSSVLELPSLQVDVEVDRVYKGDVGPTVGLITGVDGASCGADLRGATRYLVFARREEDGWTTGLCSGTRAVVDGVLPAEIGPGTAPEGSDCEQIDIPTRLADVSAAFSGEVVGLEEVAGGAGDVVAAAFEVDRVYKGDVGALTSVRTAAPGRPYAIEFVEGSRYLVFAYDGESGGRSAQMIGGPGPGLVTWTCAGTGSLVGDAPAELGKGAPPISSTTSTAEASFDELAAASTADASDDPLIPIWPALVIGVLVALGAGWGVRRWELRRKA